MTGGHLRRRLDSWRFPPYGGLGEGPQMVKANREVERLLGVGDVEPPPPFQLDPLHKRARLAWSTYGQITQIPSRDLKRLPWVIFYPRNESPNTWLGAEKALALQYEKWAMSRPRTSVASALLRVVLRAYPKELESFEIWRQLTEWLIESERLKRLAPWRQRNNSYGLVRRGGPQIAADAWVYSNDDASTYLESSGLRTIASDSRFLEETLREILIELTQRLERDSIGRSELERSLELLENPDGRGLRFSSLRSDIARALLLPFAQRSPSEAIQETLRAFLLARVGDPRVRRSDWEGISDDALRVFLRWLVSITLEEFFRLLDMTAAVGRMWKDRKDFWSFYLDEDLIQDAWVVLGGKARNQARRGLLKGADGYGDLGRGGDTTQSVLLMRLANMTIAEWSHNGKCCFWLDGNHDGPQLYQERYRRRSLQDKANADYSVIHTPGKWKKEAANYIRRQTSMVLSPKI